MGQGVVGWQKRRGGWQRVGLNHNPRMLQSTLSHRSVAPRRSPSTRRLSGRLALSDAVAVLVWLAAGAAASYGVLHGLGQRPDVPLPMPPVTAWPVDTTMVARALGATTSSSQPTPQVVAESASPSRYAVLGVVAPTASGSGSGVALVSVDGQRPLPYRAGAVLDGRWQVQSVQRQAVVLVAMAGANGAVPHGTAPLTQTLRVPDPASLSPR